MGCKICVDVAVVVHYAATQAENTERALKMLQCAMRNPNHSL